MASVVARYDTGKSCRDSRRARDSDVNPNSADAYEPLTKTANFRGYTGRVFSDEDQQRLQQILIELSRRGVHVLLSNSTAAGVRRLYERNRDVSAAGLRAWRFPARRAVNSKGDRRGAVEELVVSNIQPRRVTLKC